MTRSHFNESVIEDFREGMCFLLSFYLHKERGWDMKGVCEKRFILHAVSCPNSGGLVDIRGYFEDDRDLLKDLSYYGDVDIRNIKRQNMKDYIKNYEKREKRYARIVTQRILNWYQKKIKV